MRAFLILASLLRICGLSLGQDCGSDFLENIDFPGTDIKFVYAADAKHCQHLCTHHSACLFFTFLRADWTQDGRTFYCYLKSTPSGIPRTETPLQGVTSGYSLKPCGPHPAPCLPAVYPNIDFPGADYRSLFTADYEECQRACTHDPFCQFFTFANDAFPMEKIRHKCHLKFSWIIPMTHIVEAKAGLVSGFSHNVEMNPNVQMNENSDTVCERKLFPGLNIRSNDILAIPAVSTEHCHALCTAHPKCISFSFDRSGYKCHMKGNPDDMTFQTRGTFTSGLPSRFCRPDSNWTQLAYEGVDFRGSDIGFQLMDDAESCQRTCTSDANCQFYTYVNQDFTNRAYWRRCFHKRTLTIPVLPKVTKLNHVVSGFTLRDCGSTAPPLDP